MKKFPWYVVHKTTKYVVAGFADYSDAETFIKCFKHDSYIAIPFVEVS